MMKAAPVALAESGRNGVSVGMSLSSLPCASGAPAGQSGKAVFVWALAMRENSINMKRYFFIGSYSNIFIPQLGILGNEFAHHLDAGGVLQHFDLHALRADIFFGAFEDRKS